MLSQLNFTLTKTQLKQIATLRENFDKVETILKSLQNHQKEENKRIKQSKIECKKIIGSNIQTIQNFTEQLCVNYNKTMQPQMIYQVMVSC